MLKANKKILYNKMRLMVSVATSRLSKQEAPNVSISDLFITLIDFHVLSFLLFFYP